MSAGADVATFGEQQVEHGEERKYGVEKSREDRCDECDRRVTVGTDGRTEFGHDRGCSRRESRYLATYSGVPER